ncbi:hypothetical protein KSP39_PZI019989 [Platanthera zijinensis]|uniref:Uncharacterized protein n=1 Tax=Platanthera zijinensis TaxID=2320716 RepID=A0AAP0FWP8_9ASPA
MHRVRPINQRRGTIRNKNQRQTTSLIKTREKTGIPRHMISGELSNNRSSERRRGRWDGHRKQLQTARFERQAGKRQHRENLPPNRSKTRRDRVSRGNNPRKKKKKETARSR